jgi:Type II intron maturase/Reverse transcriptase (RNA-dependent DNA polymerase)
MKIEEAIDSIDKSSVSKKRSLMKPLLCLYPAKKRIHRIHRIHRGRHREVKKVGSLFSLYFKTKVKPLLCLGSNKGSPCGERGFRQNWVVSDCLGLPKGQRKDRDGYYPTRKIIRGIQKKMSDDPKSTVKELYSLLSREDFIYQEFNILPLKSKITTLEVKAISKKIKEGKYDFKPLLVMKPTKSIVPKPIGSLPPEEKKPLVIPTVEDKLVYEMLKTILEAIYEPIFTQRHWDWNSGFRSGGSPQDCMDRLVQRFVKKNTPWAIVGHIEKAYDTIDHRKLTEILSKTIKDQRFIKLIRKCLKAGIMEEGNYKHSILGTPLTLLFNKSKAKGRKVLMKDVLFNIYMGRLDEYILDYLWKEIQDPSLLREKRGNGTVGKSVQFNFLAKVKQRLKRYQKVKGRTLYVLKKGTARLRAKKLMCLRRSFPPSKTLIKQQSRSSNFCPKGKGGKTLLKKEASPYLNKFKQAPSLPDFLESQVNTGGKLLFKSKVGVRSKGKLETIQPLPPLHCLSLNKELKKGKDKAGLSPSNQVNTSPTDMKKSDLGLVYTRYGDDWVITFNGTRAEANKIKEKVKIFLREELKLELSEEKSKITNLRTEKAQFLGFTLSHTYYSRKQSLPYSYFNKLKVGCVTEGKVVKKDSLSRLCATRLKIGIDTQKIRERLFDEGFLKHPKKVHARYKSEWTVLTDYEILQKYNYIIREFIYYYAQNIKKYSHIGKALYPIIYSCYHTMAFKHRMSLKKVITKYGNPMRVTKTQIKGLSKRRTQKTVVLLDYMAGKTVYEAIRERKE